MITTEMSDAGNEPAPVQLSNGDSSITSTQSSALCPVCSSAVDRHVYAVNCCSCGKSAHLSCLVTKYRESGAGPAKSSLEWIHGFIQHRGLQFICQPCQMTKDGNTRVSAISGNSDQATDAFINLRVEIAAISKHLDDKQSKMQQLINASDKTTCSEEHIRFRSADTSAKMPFLTSSRSTSKSPSSGPDDKSNSRKPLSYANVVSGDVSSVVKAVVSQTMKEQQRVSDDKSTIVIYGFPEDGNDRVELREMFDFIGCRCAIAQHTRIGCVTDHSRSRPIKVKLNSPGEANLIISCAKYLKSETYYAGVNLGRWLSLSELENVKQLRLQCAQLNSSSKEKTKGRNCFVVVSGRIMKRDAKGKLQYFKNDTTQSGREALGDVSLQATTNDSSLAAPTAAVKHATQPKNE